MYSATWQISGKLVMRNRLMFRENLLLLFQNVVAKNLPMDHFEDQVDVNATQDRTNVDAMFCVRAVVQLSVFQNSNQRLSIQSMTFLLMTFRNRQRSELDFVLLQML